MYTYLIECKSLEQGYLTSKTITADSERQVRKIFNDDFGDGLAIVRILKI